MELTAAEAAAPEAHSGAVAFLAQVLAKDIDAASAPF
jgi:hypothetical protein